MCRNGGRDVSVAVADPRTRTMRRGCAVGERSACGIPRVKRSRRYGMRDRLAGRGCRQRVEFLLEPALRRGEIENRAGDAIEIFNVHLEIERIDIAERPAFGIVPAQLAIDVFIGAALTGVIGFREIRLAAQVVRDPFVIGELPTVIEGNGVHPPARRRAGRRSWHPPRRFSCDARRRD